MKKLVLRTLAVGAAAPFAFVGMVGSAGAAVDVPDTQAPTYKVGNLITADCEHPDFDLDNGGPVTELGFQVQVLLEGAGLGSDQNDVESVRVLASDDDAVAPWANPAAHAKKMTVKYFDDQNVESIYEFIGVNGAEPVYAKSLKKKSVRDGDKTFGKERDNITYITVQVKWKVAGDNENLTCIVPVDENSPFVL